MELSPAEAVAVRRAVRAYREMRNKTAKGAFQGRTADEILDELRPTPERWAVLAALVIDRAESER
ncbi:MAG: hypothetical protein AMXMBFR53_22120 [Gemmatimonadota bacterium]